MLDARCRAASLRETNVTCADDVKRQERNAFRVHRKTWIQLFGTNNVHLAKTFIHLTPQSYRLESRRKRKRKRKWLETIVSVEMNWISMIHTMFRALVGAAKSKMRELKFRNCVRKDSHKTINIFVSYAIRIRIVFGPNTHASLELGRKSFTCSALGHPCGIPFVYLLNASAFSLVRWR